MWRALAKIIMKIGGWKVVYPVPKESDRCVMIAAPHTTNWDGFWVLVALLVLDIPFKVAVKDTWTNAPLIGNFMKNRGFLGINRSRKKEGEPRKSQTEQMADFFKTNEKIAMVIAPEGTRRLRPEWKMGFYHIAKMANVPITYGFLDYAKKEAGVGGVVYPTDDVAADMKEILTFYENITPKYPEQFSLDQRYT